MLISIIIEPIRRPFKPPGRARPTLNASFEGSQTTSRSDQLAGDENWLKPASGSQEFSFGPTTMQRGEKWHAKSARESDALPEGGSEHIVNQLGATWATHEARYTVRTQPSCKIREVTWATGNSHADAALVEKPERCGERRIKIVDDLFTVVALAACIFPDRQAVRPEKDAIPQPDPLRDRRAFHQLPEEQLDCASSLPGGAQSGAAP